MAGMALWAMLEPKRSQTARSGASLTVAVTSVAISGSDVAKATSSVPTKRLLRRVRSAVIFTGCIIVGLRRRALSGVAYRAIGAAALLRRNLLLYGLGGIVPPFVGIKLIDMALTALGVS